MAIRPTRLSASSATIQVPLEQVTMQTGSVLTLAELREALAEASTTTTPQYVAAGTVRPPILQHNASQELATDLPSLVTQLDYTSRFLVPFGARRAWRSKVEHVTELLTNAASELKEVIACNEVTSTLVSRLRELDDRRSRRAWRRGGSSVQIDLPALGRAVASFVRTFWNCPWREIELSYHRMKRAHAVARRQCRRGDSELYACLLTLQGRRALVRRIHAQRISPTRIVRALEAAVVIVRSMEGGRDAVDFGPAWLHEAVTYLNNAVYLLHEMQRKVSESHCRRKSKLDRFVFWKDNRWQMTK